MDGPHAAYIMIKERGVRTIAHGNLDLFRSQFSMVNGSDEERRNLVQLASRYEAGVIAGDYEINPEFAAKVKAAIEYAKTGV